MREDVLALQGLAAAFQSGGLTAQQAEEKAGEISTAFGILWRWMNNNGVAVSVLLTALTLILTVYRVLIK